MYGDIMINLMSTMLIFVYFQSISMPHQWLEGNLPVSAKCSVCDKTCGSVLRLQDWRCLWCKSMVRIGLCLGCKSMVRIGYVCGENLWYVLEVSVV